MNKKQVEQFAIRVNYGRYIIIIFGHENLKKLPGGKNSVYTPNACCHTKIDGSCFKNVSVISIGSQYWKENKRNADIIKMMILHEVGHSKIKEKCSESEHELRAQLWGISRAYKMGLRKISDELKKQLEDWKNWGYTYKKAYKLFKKGSVL